MFSLACTCGTLQGELVLSVQCVPSAARARKCLVCHPANALVYRPRIHSAPPPSIAQNRTLPSLAAPV